MPSNRGSSVRSRLEGIPSQIWTMSVLMIIGGTLCLLATVLPVSGPPPVEMNVAFGSAMLVAAAALLLTGRRVTTPVLHAMVVAGTIAMSVIIANAATGAGEMITAFAYVWICVYVGQFFTPRWTRAYAALVSVAFAAGLLLNDLEATVGAWAIVTVTAFVITETLSRLNQRLRAQANTDPLTGALNRNGLVSAAGIAIALSERAREPLSIAVIDLDDFKGVNDRVGHVEGDRILTELVSLWKSGIRSGDALARVGGDEFVIVMPSTGDLPARKLLERLRRNSPVGWSVGVELWKAGDTLDGCIARADRDLYRAKSDGRVGFDATGTSERFGRG